MKKTVLSFLLAFCGFLATAQVLTPCEQAFSLGNSPVCMDSTWTYSGEQWFTFVADSSSLNITVLNSPDTTDGHAHTMVLYDGVCGSEIPIAYDSLSGPADNFLQIDTTIFVPGNTYLIQILSNKVGCDKGCGESLAGFEICVLASLCNVINNFSFPFVCNYCPNESFEWLVSCPTTTGEINLAYRWFRPTDGTPDLYNSCATAPIVDVPQNGFQFARTGNGMAAIYTSASTLDYREYTEVQLLNSPLTAGSYYAEMYVLLDDASQFATNQMGMYFSPSPVVSCFFNGPYTNLTPQVSYTGPVITNTATWTKISGCFTTTGGERYLMIGNFRDDANTTIFTRPGFHPTVGAYYFMDDVAVIKLTANAGPNQTIACGTSTTIGVVPPCPIPGETYSWVPSTGLTCPTCSTTVASPTVTTTYTLTVTAPGGCTATSTTTVFVSGPTVTFTIPVSDNTCGTSTYTANVTGGTAPYTYLWTTSGNGTIVGPNTNNQVIVNWNFSATAGTVTLVVTDANGCTTTATINVAPCCINPNQNGTNHVTIFNTTASAFLASGNPNILGTIYDNNYGAAGSLYINGVFTIDASMQFRRSTIRMGPNARIEIPSAFGTTLTITSTNMNAGCNYMWDGIFIRTQNCTLIVNNSGAAFTPAVMRDADSLIVSDDGGIFQVDALGIFFNDNYKNVVVTPHTTFNTSWLHTATMQRSTGMIPPRLGQTSFMGVELRDVRGGINIGDPGATFSVWGNLFNELVLGIRSIGSNATIMNNEFRNIRQQVCPGGFPPPPCPVTGVGIWGTGSPGGNLLLTIGGLGANEKNFFTLNTSNGVLIDGKPTNIAIRGNDLTLNTFLISSAVGVNIQNVGGSNILIENNNFFRYKTGIFTRFTGGSNLSIQGNNMAHTGPPVFNRGIVCMDAISFFPPPNTNIIGNTIQNVDLGIHAVNMFNINIRGNTVNFLPPMSSTANFYGIWGQGLFNAQINGNNQINRTAGPPLSITNSTRWLGIRVDNSPGILVDKNTITDMGTGIHCFQSLTNCTLACNTMNSCWFGFNFVGPADPSTQISPNIATKNEWLFNIDNKLTGSVSPPFDWYYNGGANFLPFPQNIPASNYATALTPQFTSNTFNICPTLPFFAQEDTAAVMRENLFGKIVRNEKNFIQAPVEFNYFDKKYAHRHFKDHPNWLTLNVPVDTTFQNFFASTDNSNIGAFSDVQDNINSENFSSASTLNASISPACTMEQNRQTVNSIYLNTVAQGILYYSPQDSALLRDIAVQNPLYGGDAVYSARVMLDMMVFTEDTSNSQREQQAQEYISHDVSVSNLYPNPNNGEMQIDFSVGEGIVELNIYDLTGRKLSSYTLQGTNTLKINESKLNRGIYTYEIRMNSEIKSVGKFVVIK
ncbi:MAG: T9SS type A sorting domain-containing protein [Bacteroidia bacterium]|nr:T9SS type A sorting domain-containing protein [Bacteroidia bacterium]